MTPLYALTFAQLLLIVLTKKIPLPPLAEFTSTMFLALNLQPKVQAHLTLV